MLRTCNTCNLEKELEDFHLSIGSVHGRSRKCKSCTHQAQREYRKTESGRTAALNGATSHQARRKKEFGAALVNHHTNMANIRHKYGLKEAELREMLDNQKGACAICSSDLGTYEVNRPGRVYHIDHDHTTGQVRGLLCPACNTMLGCMEKHDVSLHSVAEYLSGKWRPNVKP